MEINSNKSQAASICPSCKENGKPVLEFSGTFHGHRFSLHKCESCSVCYTFPVPSDQVLEEIYSGDYWIRESAVRKRGQIAGLVQKFNETRLAFTVKPLLDRLPGSASILEVGCGAGQLAAYLKQRGYAVEVTDIDRKILDEINNEYGINGYQGSIEEISFQRSYDAVIFNNVLEHLPDPSRTLQRAEQLLNPEGFLFVEVPNIDSLQFKLFGKSWFPLQIPQHLYHFSPETLGSFAGKAELKEVWRSTFSPRISGAGYAASLFPFLKPEEIRKSWSKLNLFLYLTIQILFLPLAYIESLAGRGSSVRAIFQKK